MSGGAAHGTRVLAIAGATATGKSTLALALAERLGGEVVNADALQVYRGLDIGTAKPTAAERAGVPHHLIDILEPDERYSAGEFVRRARPAIEGIAAAGRVPIVVGGSGLYQRALVHGLAALPAVAPAVRAHLRERLRTEGLPRLRAELAAVDPATAARLQPADSQRTLRALELWHATGETWSSWLAGHQPANEHRVLRIGLTLERAILYDRIETRVRGMVAAGWVEEVRALVDRAQGSTASLADWPGFQAIGYRQLLRVVAGASLLDQALGDTIAATRHYAKRQETWFRHENEIRWFDADRSRAEFNNIVSLFESSF